MMRPIKLIGSLNMACGRTFPPAAEPVGSLYALPRLGRATKSAK